MVEHRAPGFDLLVLLGVVPDAGVVPQRHLAQVGSLDSGQDAEQCRLARAVEADQQHPLATLHGELDVDEDQIVAERLGQTQGRQGHPARLVGLGEGNSDLLPALLDLDQVALHPIDPGLPGSGDLRHLLGGALEPPDVLLEALDGLVLMLALSLLLQPAAIAFDQVVASSCPGRPRARRAPGRGPR